MPQSGSPLSDQFAAVSACACDPTGSRGRLHEEPAATNRNSFQRDRDRIIHSSAFRRLQYKTQVFVYHEGENFRTRLTHSLEVAQIARSIARDLGLQPELAEALALSHDLGHTCFGHAGERALKECMAAYNGFDHNAQSLRIVTRLESKYAGFDGLNLCWETLEGLVKHNGPLTGPKAPKPEPLPKAIEEFNASYDLELDRWPSLEAQVAAVSDDIAYNTHDIDDGLRAGLFSVDDLRETPLIGPILSEVIDLYGTDLERPRMIHEVLRRMISAMIDDVCRETLRRVSQAGATSEVDVRAASGPLAGFSDQMAAHDKNLKGFLFPNMYRHHRVNRMTSKARRVVKDLFELFIAEPVLMPEDWNQDLPTDDPLRTARRVADYLAGMTDKFALDEHSRLFDPLVRP